MPISADGTRRVADSIIQVQHNSSAIHEPLLSHVLDALERLSFAWNLLCEDTGRHGEALAAIRERACRVIDQLQSLVNLAGDTLATSPFPAFSSQRALAASESLNRSAATPAANDERGPRALTASFPSAVAAREAPSLRAYFLGPFQVSADDVPIEAWPNGKSKAVLKYLLLNHKTPVPKEVLMDQFWPDADPECARNSLNVSIHRLRRALGHNLENLAFILFRDGCYVLNPKLRIWTDADAFMGHLERARALERVGDSPQALDAYAACVALYNAELLTEDRYDDWLLPLRQQLRDGYLAALDKLGDFHLAERAYSACMAVCGRILAVDSCDEKAHRALMRCYAGLCQPQLAQRQYQLCVQALSREMSMPPSAETTELYRRIARRQEV